MNKEERIDLSPFDIAQMGKSGSLREAFNAAMKKIRDGDKDNELFYVAAGIAYELGDMQKAEQLVKHLLLADSEQVNGWLLYGGIYNRRGEINRYAYCVNRAEEISPALSELNLRALAKGSVIEEKTEINGSGSTRELSFDTATYAEICVRQGYYNKALKIYGDLRDKDPDNSEYASKIEDIRKKMGKHD